MEPALKTFLDEVEDETVGSQRLRGLLDEEATHTVDNDNDSKDQSTSGVIDLRDMARRYKEGLAMGEMGIVDSPVWDSGASLAHILPPAPEPTKKSRSGIGVIIAASLAMAALLIGGTALVTAKLVRASVIAEMSQKAVPAPAAIDTEQAPVAVAAVSMDTELDEPAEMEPIEFEVDATSETQPAPQRVAMVVSAAVTNTNTSKSEPARVESTSSKPKAAVVVAEAQRETKREARRARVAAAKPEPTASAEAVSEPESAASFELAAEAKSEPQPAKEEATEEKETCDEVLCLVEGRGCCGKNPTAVAAAEPEKEEVDLSLPSRLTRSDISKALARYNGRLSTCGLKNGVTGAASVKFKINADGSLKSASTSAGNEAFQSCISEVLKKASFSEARGETTLSYPIIIR